MKKKFLILMLAVSVAAALTITACGKTSSDTDTNDTADSSTDSDETENTDADSTDDSDSGEQEDVESSNPMVEVSGADSFRTELGISIDMDQISMTPDAYYIINGATAQIDFTTVNVNGDDTELCLRASKDETVAEDIVKNLAGIYDTDMSDSNTVDVDGTEFTVQTADTLQTTIYSWKVDDTYFTFSIGNGMSQMSIAELMDQMAAATKQS